MVMIMVNDHGHEHGHDHEHDNVHDHGHDHVWDEEDERIRRTARITKNTRKMRTRGGQSKHIALMN